MDGIVNLLKPTGITSARALDRVRRITTVRKSGHAGTLDPAADGVLVICLGKATKLVERIMDQPKIYRAVARLDVTSESYDSDHPLQDVPVGEPPTRSQVADALASFEGDIEQIPPRISAVKVRGRPAYKRARAGEAVELAPRPARIYWLHLHRYQWPELDFEMACGRGTYVRSLIRDLGQTLSTGGCLTALRRDAVGPFTSTNAWTFEALERATEPTEYVMPLTEAVQRLAKRPIPDRPT
jgi:tRNA pseudouridine55 synthase